MKRKWLTWKKIVILLPLAAAAVCILLMMGYNHQAALPMPAPVSIVGEYSCDGGEWKPIPEDLEVSGCSGELELRGHLSVPLPEGAMLCFYRNHIGITVELNGEVLYTDGLLTYRELSARLFSSMCGQEWMELQMPEVTPADEVVIRLQNPHPIGNRSAYRDFLVTLCASPWGSSLLRENLEGYGNMFRVLSGILLITSLLLLGAAVASLLLRFSTGNLLLKYGLILFFGAGFFYFDTVDVSFQSQMVALNTYGKHLCAMLGVFCVHLAVCHGLSGKRKKTAESVIIVSALLDTGLLCLSVIGLMVLYDAFWYWAASQMILCPVVLVCCLLELLGTSKENRLMQLSGILLCGSVLLDILGVGATLLSHGTITKIVILPLFILHMANAARQILINHQAATKLDTLEKEVEDSRIAIMLSQIQPHFLYNVLGTIRGLCREDPEQAWCALGDFSHYLRGNMNALTNRQMIRFTSELQHIETYLRLEVMRMGDRLNIQYDIQETDFMIPPLAVQPLVENAVKHGLFDCPGGGTVLLQTRKEGDQIHIVVQDNGVGFDMSAALHQDERHAHVGLENVRSRLKAMTGGTLTIQSAPGEGSIVTIVLPHTETVEQERGNYEYTGSR